MMTFLTIVHVATIVFFVIAVLLQSGKGAEISASFGGSSQTVFGSSGGQNFFQKLTYGLAGVFMITSLALTILPSRSRKSVFEGFTPPPAAPQSTEPVPARPMGGDAPAAQREDAVRAKGAAANAKASSAASGTKAVDTTTAKPVETSAPGNTGKKQ
jgi:preprotein translocase subunit SecG